MKPIGIITTRLGANYRDVFAMFQSNDLKSGVIKSFSCYN